MFMMGPNLRKQLVQTADEMGHSATSDGSLFDKRQHVPVLRLGQVSPASSMVKELLAGSIPC